MPYVEQKRRYRIDDELKDIVIEIHDYSVGDMNYIITRLIHKWIQTHNLCYANLNEVIGILESVKQEFYRTVVAPYEDQKRKENGSVSELDKEKLE